MIKSIRPKITADELHSPFYEEAMGGVTIGLNKKEIEKKEKENKKEKDK